MGRPKSELNALSEKDLLAYCSRLYDQHGAEALTYSFLKSHRNLYFVLYARGIRQKDLATRLGLEAILSEHMSSRPIVRAGREFVRRTWSQIVEEARPVAAAHGSLPPAQWFQKNGHASMVQGLYNLGRTWDELRDAVGDKGTGAFVQSRNGMRWRSHPEASFSNFLFARAIEHRRGDRYPKEYEALSGKTHGRFDLHFHAAEAWIDVEIWGDDPGGHGEENYRTVRASKERFNADNPRFLGVHYETCFSEKGLSALLAPFIGTIAPFQFERPTDQLVDSTHWSNADELLDYCRQFVRDMPDGKFPTDEWLRKRGQWADRDGPAHNTLTKYIGKWLGGVRNLRQLLGQGHVSTTKWDRPSVLAAWLKFWQTHGCTPNQAKAHHERGISEIPTDVLDEAARLSMAVVKYAGGSVQANAELGIVVDRKRKGRPKSQHACG